MKTLRSSLLAGVLLCTVVVTPAFAQSPPDRGEEHFGNIFLAPWAQYDAWFPNKADWDHKKVLTMDVFAGSLSPTGIGGAPAAVHFKFDWLDPRTGQTEYSPDFPFIVTAAGETLHATWEIPFCPPQVSIHFEIIPDNQHPGTTVFLGDGLFVHECMVPEASETAMLMGVGALGFGMVRWYRKPRTT